MPAARYWRFTGFVPQGTGDLELSEWALWEAGVRVNSGAVLNATIAPTTGMVGALSDGSNAAVCGWSNSRHTLPGFALVYDLGSPKEVDELRIGAGASPATFPLAFAVQHSNDGFTWGVATAIRGVEWPGPAATVSIAQPFTTRSVVITFDGAHGDASALNAGYAAGTVSFAGGAALTTGFARFGSAALALNGSNAFVAVTPARDGELFAVGQGDFAIGCHVRYVLDANPRCIWGFGEASPFRLVVNNGTLRLEESSSGTLRISGPSGLNATELKHVLVQRVAGVIRVFVDGVKIGSDYSSTANYSTSQLLRIGCNRGDSWFFNGTVDEFEISVGAALYDHAGFTPPVVRPTLPSGRSNALPLRTVNTGLLRLATPYDPPPVKFSNFEPRIRNHRRDFEGWGRIARTVKEKGTPVNTPVRRHVFCMDMLTCTVVADTWSDESTGEYVFTDLDLTRKYTVFAYDHTLAYRAVIADNLLPEPMP
mgnify:CR=1 FL=1